MMEMDVSGPGTLVFVLKMASHVPYQHSDGDLTKVERINIYKSPKGYSYQLICEDEEGLTCVGHVSYNSENAYPVSDVIAKAIRDAFDYVEEEDERRFNEQAKNDISS